VPLEGWYIPAAGPGKLIIANHPSGFSRSGLPSHLEPWKSLWDPSGNGFEVNFVPDYQIYVPLPGARRRADPQQ
jgi:uncharacterized protein